MVYWGFTASTGGASNFHQFCLDVPDISIDTDYVFELIVNDGEYNSLPSQVTIFAKANNTAPSAIVQTSLQVNKGSVFDVDASASTDATLHTNPFNFNWSYPDFVLQGNDGESIITLLAPDVNVDTDFAVSLILDDAFELLLITNKHRNAVRAKMAKFVIFFLNVVI